MCNNNLRHAETVQTAFEPLGKPTPAMLVKDVAEAYFPTSPKEWALNLLRKEIGKHALNDKKMCQILNRTCYSRWFQPDQINYLIQILGMPGKGFING